MQARTARASGATRSLALLMAVTALLLLGACGGGSATDGPPGTTTVPPSNLAYAASAAVYRTDDPIPPNVPTVQGDPVALWSIDPPLPPGLGLDATSGAIGGIPTTPAAPTVHMVTAANAGGSTTASVSIEVQWHESRSLAPKANPTDADLRHFLDRTHFGFSQPHFDALQALGLAAYLDGMTTYADTSQLESDAADLYLKDANDPAGDFPSETDLARWWLAMMILNPNPFQEVLAFKWHDHFAASSNVLSGAQTHFYVDHVNLWRHEGTGSLRTLLLDMARDWTMLVYLDGVLNRDGNVNENFGREWFELFTLGVDVEYTQADIVEAARAFTGYRARTNTATGKGFIEFDVARHDGGSKTILGQTIPAQDVTDDYAAVVDITLSVNEAGTGASRVGQWFARSLWTQFCYDDPPQNVIDELGNDLRDGNWMIKPVLVKLFQSEAFFSARAREAIVKGPVEHVAGFMRATNLLGDPVQIDRRLVLMGHRPTQPPTVDGWPGGTQWLSAQGMVDRANMLHYLTVSAQGFQANLGITALALLPAPDADSGLTVDALAERLNVPLAPTERTECTTYLDTSRDDSGNVTPDPFDPAGEPAVAEERLRGLLWILAQHPSYQVR